MKIPMVILNLFFLISFTFSQDNFLIGKWNFEKIPDYIEIDEKSSKIANTFFKEMSLSFDMINYNLFYMGKTEIGKWTSKGENIYEFKTNAGYIYEVEIKILNDKQIIFKSQKTELQLIKSEVIPTVKKEKSILNEIEGVSIDKEKLLGKWYHDGVIKDNKEQDLILKHNNNELVNYSFFEDGKFINRAPLEIELIAIWEIAEDNQSLIIKSEDLTEYLKVVKLTNHELHLYNPQNKYIIKFKR